MIFHLDPPLGGDIRKDVFLEIKFHFPSTLSPTATSATATTATPTPTSPVVVVAVECCQCTKYQLQG